MNYPIEFAFPDITAHAAGNTGTPYVFEFDSGVAGPIAMVCALTHGNEMSGAVVLDALLTQGFRPRRGKLILSFNNVAAFAAFDVNDPDAARYVDEDFNRVWEPSVLDGARDSVELRRARAVRPFVDKADFLLDIHSMHEKCAPIMVCGPLDKGLALGKQIGAPHNLMQDLGHASGRRMRDYEGFGDPASPKNANLIECGQHWEATSVVVAKDVTARFLLTVGVSDAADLPTGWLRSATSAQRISRVTQAIAPTTEHFRFAQDFKGLEVLAKGETIGWDGQGDTAQAINAPYDGCVLIMPSLRHAGPGVTVVRLAKLDE